MGLEPLHGTHRAGAIVDCVSGTVQAMLTTLQKVINPISQMFRLRLSDVKLFALQVTKATGRGPTSAVGMASWAERHSPQRQRWEA